MKNKSIFQKLQERIKIAFQVRLCHFIDKLVINSTKYNLQKNTLLIMRLDAIGDYILFRNFLEELAKDKIYKNYKRVLCGNIMWKSLFEEWDKEIVNHVIWIDRKKFYQNPSYRYQKQKEIRKQGFEITIESTYSRLLLFGDAIVNVSGAAKRIGNEGNTDNLIEKEKKLADSFYTQLLQTPNKPVFEFDRNKIFFEEFLDKKIQLNYPTLTNKIKVVEKKQNQIVLFIGASEVYKTWHFENFATLILELYSINNQLEFILIGGKNEQVLAKQIIEFIEDKNDFENQSEVTDLTGKTNLIELTQKIAESNLLITNETVASHLGTVTRTKTICIANGRHIGRFSPYPNNYELPTSYIFPPKIEEELNQNNKEIVYEKYCNSMGMDINEIEMERVLEEIKKVLD
ncbi:ADP-heptose:LPS heptosyltransferase [Bernardetia litoralis DSM 6794]|uniref:ADP-heptose:LPS heptosyltransferase n=1 Tax=Bernardetia litoralis (strain ATCC 23117 / DSM 6794 / NBRC 15988 / NCIMB 1366 / Fx l1 / Sio-4) TaxID=880071 RepID=I4AIJ7_BERLS|nr:glycosyltransferase family 9 protein [Bernardetia litoralis]AFM03782.1 ADP-heptose:LPS heptosyltransferase [Bernardetia litoralis DSM 6794]